MHVVAIHGWEEETTALIQALAAALGTTAYEMRQRMIGGGPSVVACFADPQQAKAMAEKMTRHGVRALIVDTDALRSKDGRFLVRRFELKDSCLLIEAGDGQTAEIAHGDIDLLLPGSRILTESGTITVTERKFSLGKTILSGGIPLTRKAERQEEVNYEERENILHLYAAELPPVVFSQSGLAYDGFGAAMKLSRELNFAFLKSELRRLCPAAGYDDRFQIRLGQVRLLGPTLSPETNLDLAFDILARTVRRKENYRLIENKKESGE